MPRSREDYEVLYPVGAARLSRAPARGSLLSGVLGPAAAVYTGVSEIVRRSRMGGRGETPANTVVVSVGNIELGGNGKTPFAANLVGELARRGGRSAYVSRGFRSEAENLGVVTVLLPASSEPVGWAKAEVRLLRRDAPGLSAAVGDEGAMVAADYPEAPLAFSKDRRRAVEAVCALFAPTHIVLDDAFQTWSVARDVDIVLLDAEHPMGNGKIVPAGSLREGPRALSRADAIGFNGLEREAGGTAGALAGRDAGGDVLARHRDWVGRMVSRQVPVFGIRRDLSFWDPAGAAAQVPESGDSRCPAAALSSIGRPRRFEEALARRGVTIGLALRYPDHHRYRPECVERIERILTSRGITRVFTTAKDWVKLREVGPPRTELRVARLGLDIVGDDPVSICEKPRALPAASA